MAITTPELVRAALPRLQDAQFDAPIAQKIAAVSDYAEKRMGRHLKSADRRTETYEMRAGRKTLWLRGFPITSVSYVKVNGTRDFLSPDPPIDPLLATDYSILNATGQIQFINGPGYSPAYVEINYIGGMADDTADFVAKYPDISEAATNEVVNRFNREKNPEGNLATPFGNSVVYSKQLDTLDLFNKALDTRLRVTF